MRSPKDTIIHAKKIHFETSVGIAGVIVVGPITNKET
jgi:hypothetical protein